MILYTIGVLGADERVFQYLQLDCKTKNLRWEVPCENEKIENYALRISKQIDGSKEFGLLGVSFGGIIAIELNKIVNPRFTFLISSVEISDQLPKTLIRIGRIGILNLIPTMFIKPPQILMNYLFGAKNKHLLKEIINDADGAFIKWALQQIIHWKQEEKTRNTMRIHGANDKLISLKGGAVKIKGEAIL